MLIYIYIYIYIYISVRLWKIVAILPFWKLKFWVGVLKNTDPVVAFLGIRGE
jgi:hypothetical protein